MGGVEDGLVISNKLEIYDPAANSWQSRAAMPTARLLLGAVAFDGKLYAIGGAPFPLEPDYNLVEIYDPETNTWSQGAPMPTARHGMATVVANGRIYTIGGGIMGTAVEIVEIYDPATDTWVAGPSSGRSRVRGTSQFVGNTIYVIGGAGNVIPPHPGINSVEALTLGDDPGAFAMDAGINGNWWNGPERSGEGAQIEISQGGGESLIFVATVYSYDPQGNQIFLIAVGLVDGDSAEVDLFITDGGVWGNDFDPLLVEETQWGTGTFIGNDCESIDMELRPSADFQAQGFSDLAYTLVRLTAPVIPCPYKN